jgi:hypothetical protein
MALIKCNLCGNKVSSRAKFCPKCKCPTPPKKSAAIDNGHASAGNLVETIETIEMPTELKELFKLMATSALKRKILGVPYFETDDPRLKPWNFADAKHSIVSLLAFFLGPVFYLIKGMWRKAVTITLLFSVMGGIFIIQPGMLVLAALIFTVFTIMLLSALMAKYDYYRKIILFEKFWW